MPIPRAPESHTVDPDFDDVTLSDLTNASPILATYLATEKLEQEQEQDWLTRVLRAYGG